MTDATSKSSSQNATIAAEEFPVAAVEPLLKELLLPSNRRRLESYRFRGSTNRVYKIPVGPDSKNFVIVKLLAPGHTLARKRIKRLVRNFMYGEHEIVLGKKRVFLEIANCKEWLKEGLLVPPPIEVSLPGVRVFQGLPYPTFYTLLKDTGVSDITKLEVLAAVVRSLSTQHQIALQSGKQSLVHGDPGPWNIMFDLKDMSTYWFDLEHPDNNPHVTVEDVMVRAVRIFLYGVLDHLEHKSNEVFATFVDNYRLDFVLWRVVDVMQQKRGSFVLRAVEALGLRRGGGHRRRRVAAQLAHSIHIRDLASGARNILQGVNE